MILYGRGDFGMLAVQGRPRPEYGNERLSFLRTGMAPREVIEAVHRGGFIFTPWGGNKFEMQFAVMDRKGQTAVYTGPQCQEYAGHLQGRYCVAQGNLVVNSRMVSAMVQGFEATPGPLKYRLLAARDAAQASGGDRMEMMSAGMLIVKNGVRENDSKVVELESNMNPLPLKKLRDQLERAGDIAPVSKKKTTSVQRSKRRPINMFRFRQSSDLTLKKKSSKTQQKELLASPGISKKNSPISLLSRKYNVAEKKGPDRSSGLPQKRHAESFFSSNLIFLSRSGEKYQNQ